MRKWGKSIVIAIVVTVGGCQSNFGKQPTDQLYAPGIDQRAKAEDGLVVGNRLLLAGEAQLALDAFTRSAVDQGMTPDILSGMGAANIALGRLGTAERLLRRATDSRDATPEAWSNLGVILLSKGEYSEAVQVLRTAYALDNGESDAIRDNLRLALEMLENPVYDAEIEHDYKVVRRGNSDYLLVTLP